MPDFCCAYGCSNKRKKGSTLSFYRIPFGTSEESLKLRQRRVAAVKREKWSEKQIDNARICSAHFISGKEIFLSYYLHFLFSVSVVSIVIF